MLDKKKTKADLLAALPSAFRDEVTGHLPQTETELTAMLGALHQRGAIQWSHVPLYMPTNEISAKRADMLFADDGIMLCEYPMFSRDSQVEIWGDMRADLLYLSKNRQRVVLLENKIGGEFTGDGSDVERGQLARQIKYLNQANIANPHLVLLSGARFFEAKWYSSELLATAQYQRDCERVQAHLMKWEDIFGAVKNSGTVGGQGE